MSKQETAADVTRKSGGCCGDEKNTRTGGCRCGDACCNPRQCLPILGVLLGVMVVGMVVKKVKKSREE